MMENSAISSRPSGSLWLDPERYFIMYLNLDVFLYKNDDLWIFKKEINKFQNFINLNFVNHN